MGPSSGEIVTLILIVVIGWAGIAALAIPQVRRLRRNASTASPTMTMQFEVGQRRTTLSRLPLRSKPLFSMSAVMPNNCFETNSYLG